MQLSDENRTTLTLGDLLIETPAGWVPVRELAAMRETDGPNQILRENGSRRVVVPGNTDGRVDMVAVVEQIRAVNAAAEMPEGYTATREGTFQAQEEASRTIALLSLISMGMVFAILFNPYKSAVCALIIMGSVPLALIESVAA